MEKKTGTAKSRGKRSVGPRAAEAAPAGKPSALIDTRVIYCGDCLDRLRRLPDGCIDLIYIDPPLGPVEDIAEPIDNSVCAPDHRIHR